MADKKKNRYSQIIERIFEQRYVDGVQEVEFERDDIVRGATSLPLSSPR